MQSRSAAPINIRAISTASARGLSAPAQTSLGHTSNPPRSGSWSADEPPMKASIMDEFAVIQGVQVKARMYRMLPVLALLAVVVEGLGAGVKWY